MRTERPFGTNALAMIGARAVTLLLGLVSARILGSHLSVEAVGLYSLAAAMATFVATVSELGIRNVYVRDVAQDLRSGPGMLAAFTVVKAVVAAALLPFGVWYVAKQTFGWEGAGVGATIGIGLFANSVAIAWLSIARAHERFGWDAAGQVVYAAALLVAWAGVLRVLPTAGGVGVGILAAAAVQVVFTMLVVRHVFGVTVRTLLTSARLHECLALVRRSWAYGLGAILGIVYFRVDAIMLQAFRGLHELGFYSAAYKLFELGISAPVAIAAILLPGYARAVSGGPQAIAVAYRETFRRQCLLGGALGATLIGAAPVVVRLVWTERFNASTIPLLGLGVALTCSTIYAVNGSCLTALDRRRFIVWNSFAAVLVNVGLNLLVIPRWGAVGAAWTTAATEGWLLLASTVAMARLIRARFWRVLGPVASVVGVAVGLALWSSYLPGWRADVAGLGTGLAFGVAAVRAFLHADDDRSAAVAIPA